MAAPEGYPLLCLENPLLDIQGFGDNSILEKYDLKDNDAILAEEKHMGLYEDLLQNCDAKLIAGGAAQNTARGAQYILPENSVVYLGCVGKDKYADVLREAGSKAGIRTEYRIDDVQPTGRCGVVITGHNRSLVTHLAAANEYKLDHLKSPEIWSLVEKAKYFFVGGFHLTVCVPAIMALAEEAESKNKVFMLSLSAPFIPTFFKDPLDQVFPYTDYIIGNESEALAFAQAHDWSITDLSEIAKKMANLPKKNSQRPRTVIITHGTEPTITAVADGKGGAEVTTTPIRAIAQSEIYDTNGAGDAFSGGFCAAIVQGKSLAEAIDMGHWLANLSIRELGPQYPFPKKTYTPA